MEDLTSCLISGKPIKNFLKNESTSHHYFSYNVDIEGREYFIKMCTVTFDKIKAYIDSNQDKLYSLLLNGKKLPLYDARNTGHLHVEDLEKFISDYYLIKEPNDKLDNLFLCMAGMSKYDGHKIRIKDFTSRETYLKYYFKNPEELKFYINTLNEIGLIEKNFPNTKAIEFNLTYKGLEKSIELKEEGNNSNRCFVAMSFDKEEDYIFDECIIPICKEFDLNAIRVDRIHTMREQTINDLIIAELKKSKFIIADFTKHKDGVYFEAGYGLGRGKKVIYTCRKDYFEKLHFDVNHFPVLIYENINQLKEMLRNKIEAYILD